MAHAAEVAFALLADVRGEEDRDWRDDFGLAQSGGNAEQSGEPGGVVAGSGGEDAGAGLGRIGGRAGGENGVEVGREEDDGCCW